MILINQFPYLELIISISQQKYDEDDFYPDERKFNDIFFGIQVKDKKIRLLTIAETTKLCNEYLEDEKNCLCNFPTDFHTALRSNIPTFKMDKSLEELDYAYKYIKNEVPKKHNLTFPIANNRLKIAHQFDYPNSEKSLSFTANHLSLEERFLTYTFQSNTTRLKISIPLEYAFEHLIDLNKYLDNKPTLYQEIKESYNTLKNQDLGFGIMGQSLNKNNAFKVIRDLDSSFYGMCYDHDKRDNVYQLPQHIEYISEVKDFLKTKYSEYDPLELDLLKISLYDKHPHTWIHPDGKIWKNYNLKLPHHFITFITECYLVGKKFPFLDFVIYFIQKKDNKHSWVKRKPLFGIHVSKGRIRLLNSDKTLILAESYINGFKFHQTFLKKLEYTENNYFSVEDIINILKGDFEKIK